MQDKEIKEMVVVINECIKNNKIEFLANVICKLQREYREICELSTDGEFQLSWTHEQVLDYLTYQNKS
jgi:hypothetical protein